MQSYEIHSKESIKELTHILEMGLKGFGYLTRRKAKIT